MADKLTTGQRELKALDELACAAWKLADINAADDDESNAMGARFDQAIYAYKRAILRSERARRAKETRQ